MPKQNIFSIITEFIPEGIRSRISRLRYIIIAIIVLALIYFLFWPKGDKHEKIEFTQVTRQDIASVVSASGVLDGQSNVSLHFNSAGKLAYVKFKQGDTINKGVQVAGLDIQALNIALQQAENNLRDKQATADKVLDDVKDKNSDETFTQKQNRTTAQVARDNAFDSVKAAQRAFQDAVLYAPISGVVVQASPVPGQNVTVADTIIQISDNSATIFASDVDESDVSKLALAQEVKVTLNAYPDQVFEGSVIEISPVTKTTSSGATVVTVKISLPNPPANFVVGLNGQADIKTKQASNVLTIPLDALHDDNSVFIRNGSGYKTATIQTGIRSDTDVEITEGLQEGQEIVKNPDAVPTSKPTPTQKGQ